MAAYPFFGRISSNLDIYTNAKPKAIRRQTKNNTMKKSILEFRQFHPGTEGEEVSDAQVKGDVEYEDSEEEEAEDEDEEETEDSDED